MIASIPSFKPVLMILVRPGLLKRGLSLAWHALYHFFLPQFQTRLRPWLRPVAVPGHPLDRLIPFRPQEVRTYLGYMSFWMKSLRFLYDLLGEAALEDIRHSFDQVCLLYREAGGIYRRCQSTTTTRAAMPIDPYFVAVYLLDPHLHCIPSLHILVVCYNQHQFAEILRRHGRLDAAALPALREVEAQAVRVTEAILLVRQHSLVDIAPSLFLLTGLFPGFGPELVGQYVDGLFRGWCLPEQAKRSMRACILDGYREMEREWAAEKKGGYREVILRFLARYIPVAEG
jgi:predicted hotdog family 3-hydroxylacyl-ACP dehydratase